jgi:alkylation response protein AidB-like acyl-CoA dehydrogenase
MIGSYLLTTEEQQLQKEIREFVKSIPKELILGMDNETIKFPYELMKECAERGYLGPRVPKEYGGRGMSWVAQQMISEELGGIGQIFACNLTLGPGLIADCLVKHGTKEQKDKYIKPLLKAEIFAGEGLTEPRGGSDFFGATTTAEKKGDYYYLNGEKRFIVAAEASDFLIVFAKTNFDPNCDKHKRLTLFIVDRYIDGKENYEVSYIYGLMGSRGGGTARVTFKDSKVPVSNILGELDQGYDVYTTLMINERLDAACNCIGTARPALEVATRYSMQRKQFGKTINRLQAVKFHIADAVRLLDAASAVCYQCSVMVDKWLENDKIANVDLARIRRQVSQAKRFTTEACQEAVKHCMEVMGGIGYTNIYPIERIMRDIALGSIWTGTNDVQNLVIAHEWYDEVDVQIKDEELGRNWEFDAPEAYRVEEKVYE